MFIQTKTASILGALGVCALILSGCNGDSNNGGPNPSPHPSPSPSPQAQTSFGAPTTFGKGTARAYIVSKANVPQELGIEISKDALSDIAALPQPPAGQVAVELRLTPPAALLSTTPFVNVSLYYTPGHPPAGQQDVPHFHPTWWLVSDAVRNQILPGAPGNSTPIDPSEIPAGFFSPPDPNFAFIPLLGTIYFDPTEPGYTEAPFKTALSEYRYFNGHATGIALGTPLSFLLRNGDITLPLGVPAKYPKPGYYPTNYRIVADRASQSYKLVIGNFVQRQ